MAILSVNEIVQAQYKIDALEVGLYELSEIYGFSWLVINNATNFGVNFKETVKTGHLKKIRWFSRKTNNHQEYEIYKL